MPLSVTQLLRGWTISSSLRAIFLLSSVFHSSGWTADYPSKPIRLIVGFAPGGATDITARAVAAKLSGLLGQQVIVDNRPGATGNIGAELLAKSVPDGYTIMLAVTSLTTTSSLDSGVRKPPFDVNRDFAAVVPVAEFPNVLSVHPSVPATTVKDIIALAKAKPGELSYGSSGVGGFTHLSSELFYSMAGVSMTHVPYKGGGPSMIDLIAGRIQVLFATSSTVIPYIKAQKVKAIAVTTARRFALLPDIPTIAESGLPGYEATNWSGLFAPARTRADILKRLNSITLEVLDKREMKDFLFTQGQTASAPATPEQFSAYVKLETAKWAKVIKDAGIKVEY